MTDWPTTRRYPRTLAEAFPAERESRAVEHYRPLTWIPPWAEWCLSVMLAAGIAAGLVWWIIQWVME